MKGRRRILLILVACGVVALLAVVFWPGEKEPVYQGKKLSEWLRAYELERGTTEAEHRAAIEAVRALGTNALPCLLHWIAYEPPAWRERFHTILFKRPLTRVRERLWHGDRQAMNSVWAFDSLGSNAAPAAPKLGWLLNHRGENPSRDWVMRALGAIGREGLPYLLAVLENPRDVSRDRAASIIVEMHNAGFDISPAVPGLLILDREFLAVNAAARSYYFGNMINLRDNLAFLVPVLTNCMQHPNLSVRAEAARNLAAFGAQASTAIPCLVNALNDAEVSVRQEVTNALRRIAPDVLEAEGEHR